ncbi:MAG: DNA phosphorothioation system sulfurtransferase DndC [Candidatus Acidiferrales bacterium]
MYLLDSRPWIIAYSGGKDSTAVLQLVWSSLDSLKSSQRTKSVEIAYVDTGMEHPAYSEMLTGTLFKIEKAANAQRMPFNVHILAPLLKHRYFVAVIGRGYAPPTHWFRWCTKDMRIRPMTQFIKDTISLHSQVVIVLGLRRSESQSRSATLAKYSRGKPFQGAYGSLKRATAFTPIEDFATEEVWQFLMTSKCPWGDGNRELSRLYTLASGGECASHSLGDGVGKTCGGSRFGCWTCTVVRRDKTGEGLADGDERYEWLLDFRNWLAQIRYERKRRWMIRRNGSPGPGPLRLSTRREILYRLAQIQFDSGFRLLNEVELNEIQGLWNLDGDRTDSELRLWREFQFRPPNKSKTELVTISSAPAGSSGADLSREPSGNQSHDRLSFHTATSARTPKSTPTTV